MSLEQFWNELAAELETELRRYRAEVSNLEVSIKADQTLLTQADISVENLIVSKIRSLDDLAVVVAEEDLRTEIRSDVLARPEKIWIVDPIDGTSQFVQPDGVEFCSVVCLLQEGVPTDAFILAPELGSNRSPLLILANWPDRTIKVNGLAVDRRRNDSLRSASVTRERSEKPRDFEFALEQVGCKIKTRTTSQTIDMVRTAIDPADLEDPTGTGFDLFYRSKQKIWDGIAGLCLGRISGLTIVDRNANDLLPVSTNLLAQAEPRFDSTLMGTEEAVSWLRKEI
jgi:3'(2'), 5'-bisphosphate nucleotidase